MTTDYRNSVCLVKMHCADAEWLKVVSMKALAAL